MYHTTHMYFMRQSYFKGLSIDCNCKKKNNFLTRATNIALANLRYFQDNLKFLTLEKNQATVGYLALKFLANWQHWSSTTLFQRYLHRPTGRQSVGRSTQIYSPSPILSMCPTQRRPLKPLLSVRCASVSSMIFQEDHVQFFIITLTTSLVGLASVKLYQNSTMWEQILS